MKKAMLGFIILIPFISLSQGDTAFITQMKSLDTANILKTDTVSVPDDALTEKIKLLRSEKQGLVQRLNIQQWAFV